MVKTKSDKQAEATYRAFVAQSADLAEVDIKRIKNAKSFKEMLSDMVEKERDEKRIAAREFMGADMDDDNLT